jgi:signal transduction histidine kinase/ActR/RegA family two-component response regulator
MNSTAGPQDPTPSAAAGGVLVPGAGSPHGSAQRRSWRAIGSPTLLAALITIAAGGALIALYRRYLLAEARQRVAAQAIPYGQSLGAVLAHRVAILQGFEAFLKLQGDILRHDDVLQRYTADIQHGTPGIRALEVIRDGRIIAIAPLAGNRPARGMDVRRHSEPVVRTKLRLAETTDRVTITGPISLVQGGMGLVLRERFPRDGGTGYDLATVVLDLPPLLAEAGLADPVAVRIALRDSLGVLLYGASDLEGLDPVVVDVHLPDDRWRLYAVPAEGWAAAISDRSALFTLGVLLSGALFVLVVYLVASRQAALLRAVEERTGSLHSAVEELRKAAEERGRTEAQLLQAQRLESLGRLAGGIAHDFNNLLTVILGSLSLAHDAVAADSEAGTDLLTAERAGYRAAELTKKLLAFARRQTVEPQLVELNALLLEAQTILRRLLGEQVRMVEDLAPGLWRVFADPGQLEQVITNLVVNARDAMPDGGTLSISTRNVELIAGPGVTQVLAAGEYVRLEVSDSGAGMPPEILQRVFEPFFTTKELGQGTGLGLATAYGIVRQAGGDITLQSRVGIGTRVTIHLPRAQGRPTPAEAKAVIEEPARGGGETILLVEDEGPVRQVTVRMLADVGYRVIAAEDGDSALRRLEPTQRIDLLVSDVVTPGMGGRKLAERILDRDPGTRVLFISGYTADERLEELLARPGVAFLAKPFTAPQLQRAVRALLDHPRRS